MQIIEYIVIELPEAPEAPDAPEPIARCLQNPFKKPLHREDSCNSMDAVRSLAINAHAGFHQNQQTCCLRRPSKRCCALTASASVTVLGCTGMVVTGVLYATDVIGPAQTQAFMGLSSVVSLGGIVLTACSMR